MKKYARIEGSTVREIISHADAFDISKAYHPSLVWVEITGISPAPQEGWLYDEGTGGFAAPPPPPPPPPDPSDELVAAIANAIKDEPPGSPVRKLGEALLGQTSKGRIAGRPV